MKSIKSAIPALAFISLIILHAVPSAAGVSRYARLIEDRIGREKLLNLAALEEASIIDTQTISIYVNDPEPLIRLRAAEVMARVQSPRALPYLEKLLHDEDEEVVKEALFALGLIGDERSLDEVRSTLLNSKGEVRDEAIIALGRIGSRDATEYLATMLSNFDPHVRALAAYAIASSGDSAAAARCLTLLNDPSIEVVEAAIYTLGRLKVKGSESRIAEFLGHSKPSVRLRAAEALGRLRCKSSVELLSLLLDDNDRLVRIKAAEALWRIGTKSAAMELKGLLRSDDHYLQTIALRGIAASRASSLFSDAIKLLDSPSPMVRRTAIEAVARTGGGKARSAIKEAMARGSGLEKMTAVEMLGEIGEKKDLELIVDKLLSGKSHFEREGAAAALGRWQNERELRSPLKIAGMEERISPFEALILCAADPDWVVATTSVEAIGEHLSKSKEDRDLALQAVQRFKNVFRMRTSRVDGDLRLAIVEALSGTIPAMEKHEEAKLLALETLKSACGDPDPRVRERASQVLGKLDVVCNHEPKSLWKRGEKPWKTQPLPMGERLLVLRTSRGEIKIRLFGDDAPAVVYSIIHLAKSGFYDGLTFHRVVPGFVIQGGDPRGDGWGDAGYFLRSQFNRHHYRRGTVGMAHAGKDTAGSQFFITQLPQPHLDGRYTVVGEVIEGMDVVDKIEEQDSFTVEVIEQ